MSDLFETSVVGGGLAGAATALSLADAGHRVALLAPKATAPDRRTTALLMPSVARLESLGVWHRLGEKAAALRAMRIIDGTRRLLRAPTVTFHAGEIGEAAFGYNVANAELMQALDAAIDERSAITRFDAAVEKVDVATDPVLLTLTDGRKVEARLVVAADGRNSLIRQAAAMPTRAWSYPQTAFVLNFAHEHSHEDISTEFHTESGPFTQVPLGPGRSSLVWVVHPEETGRIGALSGEALNAEIEKRMHSLLGKVEVETPLQSFPLSGLVARQFGSGAVVLVGEAAHAFPPIGAQGLNLGLRDVAELVRHPMDLSDRRKVQAATARYDRARRADIRTRTAGVDLLNRSLLSSFLPIQFLRAAGLSVLSYPGPLRELAIREGMMPGSALRAIPDRLRERIGR
jgi:2-octaprenyl-6-methoxyphenol hydroxylase